MTSFVLVCEQSEAERAVKVTAKSLLTLGLRDFCVHSPKILAKMEGLSNSGLHQNQLAIHLSPLYPVLFHCLPFTYQHIMSIAPSVATKALVCMFPIRPYCSNCEEFSIISCSSWLARACRLRLGECLQAYNQTRHEARPG